GAEIDAKLRWFDGAEDTRIADGLLGGPGGEPGVASAARPFRLVESILGDRPVANLSGDFGREAAGIEQRGVAHPAPPLHQIAPQLGDRGAKRGNTTDAGHDDTTLHGKLAL